MSMDSSSQKSTTFFNTNFCLQLAYKVLQKQVERGLNFVSSPLSLHIILSIIAAGSSGETLKQLLSFLGSESINDLNSLSSEIVSRIRLVEDNNEGGGGPVISFVNGTWVEKSFGLKTSFEEIVKHLYKSKIEAVDFIHKAYQVKDEVNSWVENATNGLIKQLLPPGSLDEETKLVLVNALYFKGSWDQKFNPSKTLPKNFQLLNGQLVKVPFMTGVRNDEYYYKSFENFKMLKIPYQSGNTTTTTSLKFSMYFFLPHHNNINNNEGLPNLIHTFNSNPKFLNQNFGLYREDLEELWIPRFKFSSDFDAVADMRDLGLTLPFRPGDLTEISDSSLGESLCVSNILHKAFIEVNEEGTEAAASTVAILRLYNCGGMVHFHRPSFVADHPFLFMIREEKSRAVFFIGAVLNPLLDS
ncbi:serpin-ZX-like [Senna tora]|uniref:Serpin-ZX-like n=1 Tax=Senna tora TaxID=362788 RepID=A0A834STH4_9FABA|nr:serpin-ZX-like [Senna tora]